jgi:type 1 glutamine amidotransferase/HEAT repeat protein
MTCSQPHQPFPRWLLCLLTLAASLGIFASTVWAAERPLRVLIFSGQNNHDWQSTTPKLKSILQETGRFQVEVTDHPERCSQASLAEYDVLLSNWNTFGPAAVKEWPEAMRTAFLEFVRRGRGLVVVHAGSSSFPEWTEYHDLVGGAWGTATGHGPIHRFEVKMAQPNHPITRGFPSFKITDELWHRTAIRPNRNVLATAYSAPEYGGSGQHEPVAFTMQFGEGRCFNLVLGHDANAMTSVGFSALLARGTEWAATGQVSLPAPSPAAAEELDALLDLVAKLEPASPRAPALELEQLTARASAEPAARQALARKLAASLSSPNATLDGRRTFCWQLSIVGSDEQVPAIAALLKQPPLSYHARLALERIPGTAAFLALQRHLPETSGPERVAILGSLAARSDPRAISDLTALARSQESEASAALKVLGQIGGTQAFQALAQLAPDPSPDRLSALQQAQLQAAASLVGTPGFAAAIPILEKLANTATLPVTRAAAFRLWVSSLGEQASPHLAAALTNQDTALVQASLEIAKTASDSVLASLAEVLTKTSTEVSESLLGILAARGATTTLPRITPLLSSQNGALRTAASSAIGAMGNASAVGLLTSRLTQADTRERTVLIDALARLPGPGVNEALLSTCRSTNPIIQFASLKALRTRSSQEALTAFTQAAAAGPDDVRREAILALSQLANTNSCAFLISLLERDAARLGSELESALAEICRRDGTIAPLLDALPRGTPRTKASLLNVLAAVGNSPSLKAIENELNSPDLDLRRAAVRLLAEWPDPAPLSALGSLAATSSDATSRTLALRGLARLAPLVEPAAVPQTVQLMERAMGSAPASEQRSLIAALARMPDPASLKVLTPFLNQPELQAEAKSSLLKILEALDRSRRDDARPILAQLRASSPNAAETARLTQLDLKFGDLQNLCLGATATNPDGLSADGEGGPPAAAIDGNEKTYWDEVDNQKLYVLRVELKQPSAIALLRIVGWQQHQYAPRDFEVLGDGKVLTRVEGAQYDNNAFQVSLPGTVCRAVELRITGSHGPSPAIRELELYGKPAEH